MKKGALESLINDLKKTIANQESEIFKLNQIINEMPTDIYWKNLEGIYLDVNLQGIESLKAKGFIDSKSDIIGKTDREIFDELTANLFRENDLQVMKTGMVQTKEETALLVSGIQITQLSTKRPLLDEMGEIVGIIGNTVDITKLKETQKALEDAKKQAEASSQAKSEFIANMSHDIRTPITGREGLLRELLYVAAEMQATLRSKNPPSNAKQCDLLKNLISYTQQYGEIMHGSVDELLQLCNEILEVVRLDSGKSEIPIEAFDLSELVTHNIELLQSVATHRELTLTSTIDARLPRYISGLRRYLDRALLNLISNALKFTKEGGVQIVVGFVKKTAKTYSKGETIHLKIEVIDTGVGIPSDKFDVIFEHFSRLTSSYQGTYKGSGLGLYTVKRYVDAMQGEIHVKSKIGKGSCFTLILPFIVDDHADRIRQSMRTPARPTKVDDRLFESVPFVNANTSMEVDTQVKGKARILLVEDSMPAAMAVNTELKRQDCIMDIVQTGKEAIRQAECKMYDLILMDVGLPDINGIEVTRQIRALSDKKYAQAPIVGLTGHAGEDMRKTCLDAGMNEVLIKPAQPLMLQTIVDRFVWLPKNQKNKPSKSSTEIEDKAIESSDLLIIDWPSCVAKYRGNEINAKEILACCHNDLKETQANLEAAYQARDTQALRNELHRMLGGLCYIRAPQLERALKEFQAAAKVGFQDSASLKKRYIVAQAAIQAFLLFYEEKFA